jgi:hypothetical protein
MDPYRVPVPRTRSERGRLRRPGSLAVAVAVLWLLGVSRLAYAIDRGEAPAGEPALAALLTVAPPVALAFRSARDFFTR